MKNLLLFLFTVFLAYSVKAEESSLNQLRMLDESQQVIAASRETRKEVAQDLEAVRELASDQGQNMLYQQYRKLIDTEVQDPLFYLNKID